MIPRHYSMQVALPRMHRPKDGTVVVWLLAAIMLVAAVFVVSLPDGQPERPVIAHFGDQNDAAALR